MAVTSTTTFTIEDGDYLIDVTSLASFPDQRCVINIDSESILCEDKDGNRFKVAKRGYNGTTPARHIAGATVTLNEIVPSRVVSALKIGAITIFVCTGTPEGAITAPIGSLALNVSGGASTTLYVKTSTAGNTGWTAK